MTSRATAPVPDPTTSRRLKELEDENKKLKEIVADLTLDNRMLKHIAEGNW
jgi:hypothetical protein